MRPLVLSLALLLIPIAQTSADIVHLKDGSTLQGTVHHGDDGWEVTAPDGKVTVVQSDQLDSIEMKASPDAQARIAAQRLQSLEQAVQNSNNLPDIIARFQRFIRDTKDPKAVAGAKKDLATWQNRSDKNMVKIGDRWVPPQQRAALAGTATALAQQAQPLLLAGKIHEAEPLLAKAVNDDPRNPSAQYLMGVLRYTQDKVPDARKAFEAVLVALPDNAPAHNNLAVALWRQRQYVQAMSNYDSAMLGARVNRAILDNVAAALDTLPNDFSRSSIVSKARLHFKDQDGLLQQELAKQGLRRYGSTWIDQRQFAEMEQQRKVIQDKIDDLSEQYNKEQDVIHQIDQHSSSIQGSMRQIEASSFVQDPKTGNMLAVPYPGVYYQMQQQLVSLRSDQQREESKLPPLRQKALALRKQLPQTAAATNIQRIIGPAAMPVAAAATQPSTRAAVR